MFPTISVDPAKAESPEQLGTKRKYWFTDEQNRRVLFKAEQRGTGEDWAEKRPANWPGCSVCRTSTTTWPRNRAPARRA